MVQSSGSREEKRARLFQRTEDRQVRACADDVGHLFLDYHEKLDQCKTRMPANHKDPLCNKNVDESIRRMCRRSAGPIGNECLRPLNGAECFHEQAPTVDDTKALGLSEKSTCVARSTLRSAPVFRTDQLYNGTSMNADFIPVQTRFLCARRIGRWRTNGVIADPADARFALPRDKLAENGF